MAAAEDATLIDWISRNTDAGKSNEHRYFEALRVFYRRAVAASIERDKLHSAASLAADIIDVNLYLRAEQVEDAAAVLRRALGNN